MAHSKSQDILGFADTLRVDASRRINPLRQAKLGQFFTPAPIAHLMASMFEVTTEDVVILDAGAGVGILTAALIENLCHRSNPPHSISVTAYELDELLHPYLEQTLRVCASLCESKGIAWKHTIQSKDFIVDTVEGLNNPLFSFSDMRYTCAIVNPPYLKINTGSLYRRLLRGVGIETSNLYTAFLALVIRLLEMKGELVAITPRSFCNGPYFRSFRKDLIDEMSIRRFHLFSTRSQAFRDDRVLQENVIFSALKTRKKSDSVTITTSSGPDDKEFTLRVLPYDQFVHPDDAEQFFHLVPDDLEDEVAAQIARLPMMLPDLGLEVSTGRVVDFRALDYLRKDPESGTAPLIYPLHLSSGRVVWPKPGSKKPNALVLNAETRSLFVPNENYVLIKRFSSKEERKRVVATVYEGSRILSEFVGFENHLNYYHEQGHGLDLFIARGLAAYLNSTLVDTYFRHFNGHTQVNATDLRNLRYPSREMLLRIGLRLGENTLNQADLDDLITEELT